VWYGGNWEPASSPSRSLTHLFTLNIIESDAALKFLLLTHTLGMTDDAEGLAAFGVVCESESPPSSISFLPPVMNSFLPPTSFPRPFHVKNKIAFWASEYFMG